MGPGVPAKLRITGAATVNNANGLLLVPYSGESYDVKKKMYTDAITTTKPGVRYLIIHCGYNNEELQAITTSSLIRDTDRRVFTDPAVIEAVKASGVKIVSWKQVSEMNGKKVAGK